MDKVKMALVQLKKHHFWVLCLLIMVTVLVVWSLASAGVEDRTWGPSGRVSEIEKKTSDVGTVLATTNPPNPGVIRAIYELISGTPTSEGLKQEVVHAWHFLYQKQTENNPLPKVLDATFVRDFQQLEMGQITDLPESDLEQYQNNIHRYVSPEETAKKPVKHQEWLFDRVNLRVPKNAGHGEAAVKGGGGRFKGHRGHRPPPSGAQPADEEPVEMVGVLEWDESDRNRIMRQFQWEETPDTQTVRLAQEDLWVYEALLRIIEKTNKGATYENAAIKGVLALEIGKQAARSWEQNQDTVISGLATGPAAKGAAKQGAPRGRGPLGRPPRPGPFSNPHGKGPSGTSVEQESPLADRYVDDAGNPLPEGAKHPYAEFKMMPINLRVLIHQKQVTKLLAECGNSNMPIVVRAVRFRPGEGEVISARGPATPAPGTSGATPGLGGGIMPPPGIHPPSRPPAGAGPEGGTAEPPGSPYLTIEVRGIIYIYNPPDLKKLGTGAGAAPAGPAQAAPAAAPATPGGRP